MNYFEIEACVIRAKNGNQEELLKILEQYKPFIFKNARDYNIKNYDVYDLVQIGYVALINAVAKYRTGSNTFSTYAYTSIRNEFRYIARQNSKFKDELCLNATTDQNVDSNTEFIDLIASTEDLEEDLIKIETISELRGAVAKLPADEIELIIMVYYSKCSLKTYADKKGLTYLQATRKKNRILNKLSLNIKR